MSKRKQPERKRIVRGGIEWVELELPAETFRILQWMAAERGYSTIGEMLDREFPERRQRAGKKQYGYG